MLAISCMVGVYIYHYRSINLIIRVLLLIGLGKVQAMAAQGQQQSLSNLVTPLQIIATSIVGLIA